MIYSDNTTNEPVKEIQKYKQQIDEKNKVIENLRRELTHKIKELEKYKAEYETEKTEIISRYESRIEETRRDTREKVQQVY